MEEQEKNSNNSLKIIIGLLAVLLIASLAYIYKISTEAQQVQTVLVKTVTEKESVMKDLQSLKATYDAAIAENTSMSEELIAERDKVVKLMSDIEKSKGDASKYRAQYSKLATNMKALMGENEILKKQNSSLALQRDSTVVVLGEAKKYNEVLVGQNENLSKTIEKGSKLSILNMHTSAFDVRSSGKQEATEKAGRADLIKVSFTIAENQIAKSGDKQYYVQVIDSKGNVLGDKQVVNFDSNSLTYSFISKVKYENKTVNVSEDLKGKDFAKGSYFVNVFDKNEMVANTSFTLK